MFDAVVRAKVDEICHAATIDPRTLPESVGVLFDWYHEHPELIRLLLWETLESGDGPVEANRPAASSTKGMWTAWWPRGWATRRRPRTGCSPFWGWWPETSRSRSYAGSSWTSPMRIGPSPATAPWSWTWPAW
ncbi:hypothetical protein [Nonomuraea sp. B5E05]|uniref:hypothetical protein n=1 Tax=Nonomuraea sp. B5E05 TaxID=3153569 RepID=UPI003260B817